MTKKEFALLGKRLQKTFPDFEVAGQLLILKPLGDILKGIAFDGGGSDKNAFYAEPFVIELWIPTCGGNSWVDTNRLKNDGKQS